MKHPKLQRGFTLVETMVAISILMLAILGPLSIASAGLKNSIYARDQVAAYYLAQEGVEFIRYARDDNYMRRLDGEVGVGWLEDLDDCKTSNGCAIDVYEWSLVNDPVFANYVGPCGNADCSSPQMFVSNNGNYSYNSSDGVPAHFNRSIKIEPVSGSLNEVKITSTVTWRAGSFGPKSFTLTEHISDLYKNL